MTSLAEIGIRESETSGRQNYDIKIIKSHPKSAVAMTEGHSWVCLKIVYPYTQWLMIIIPIKWL